MNTPQPQPYFLFPGTAREALEHYQSVFGGELQLNSYADFGRSDGPGDSIAHGVLTGPVSVGAADAGANEDAFSSTGLLFALLGAAEPAVLRQWFDALAAHNGTIIDDLQKRPWGDYDGQVRDGYGVTWLIGYQPERADG